MSKKKILALFLCVSMLLSFSPANAAQNKGYRFPVDTYTKISQYFSSGGHNGIDIAANTETPIYATKSGTIIKKYTGCNNFSRGNGLCKSGGVCNPNHGFSKADKSNGYCNDGFGNGYIVKHDDGTWSAYAHMNYLSDSLYEGGYVAQGTYLGGVSSTGLSTGPHLHFEIRTGNVSTFYSASPLNPLDYMDEDDKGEGTTPTKHDGLMLGDKGDDVKKLQETLNGMTGTSLNADGHYGSNTEKAVKEYQSKKGLTADGWYGASTKAVLEDEVKKLQETLNGMTGTSLNADGHYGSNTKEAVKAYQKKKGLTTDGWYGASTKAALEGDVKTLQNMLNAVTGTALNADGYYGSNTEKAVKAYQQKKGLIVDGWYGASTKSALEADYKNLTSPSSPTPTSAPISTPSESDKSETSKEPATEGDMREITTPASFHFAKKTRYTQGQFTDVPASQWYTDNVASAFETGLMVGKSDTTFSPFTDVTIAEAATMAARVHSIYTTGTENFVSNDTWYQPYLDYAYQNGIISEAYYNCDVIQKANRAQFAEIFANSLPSEALPAINSIADNAIPDVKTGSPYAGYVYKLYRAGILAGGDARGTFSPDTYITRAEAASIVSRLGDTDLRVSFSLD